MINRTIKESIKRKIRKGKAILLFGARQTGKTTLIKEIVKEEKDVLWFNGDESDTKAFFEEATSTRFRAIFGNKRIIVLDEAQRIEQIGLKLKIIADSIPDVQLIATGSSSFELAEPLTGRKWDFELYPFSFAELAENNGLIEEKRLLPHRLIYGSYPEVVNSQGNEKEVLKLIVDSYLYKDILMIEGIKKQEKLIKLLKAIALQVGNEVKYTELGQTTGLNHETVEKYIELLEKAFVIFRLGALSRNLRNELKKSRKIYFYDNGVMNSLTAQFQSVEFRKDIGALWENYLISERKKYLSYKKIWANTYFWRTHEQQEIDYIEEKDGIMNAYEFKWNPNSKFTFSKTFKLAYPEHTTTLIHRENIEQFLKLK